MTTCARCGHELGVGRFCTNCGHPVGEPAPAPEPVPSPRPVPPPRATPRATTGRRAARRRGRVWPWVVFWLVLAIAAAVIGWTLGRQDAAERDAETRSAETSGGAGERGLGGLGAGGSGSGTGTDVARFAEATVPATAPPNEDLSGNLVRYEARQMLDGVPATAWRMPGDGTGSAITIELAERTRLTEVGIINGYAKAVPGTTDWYPRNRRISEVSWTFDDGTSLTQDLAETTAMQVLELPDVTTSTVQLTILGVTEPAPGAEGRDFTAISDVALVGSPG
jgi:hypothetical protein